MVNNFLNAEAVEPVDYIAQRTRLQEQKFFMTYSDDRGVPFHISPEKPESIILRRQNQCLVLFRGVVHPQLTELLSNTNLNMGILLSSNEYRAVPSIESYCYALIGTKGDQRPSFREAIKELYRRDWVLADPAEVNFKVDGPLYVSNYIKLIVANSLLSF